MAKQTWNRVKRGSNEGGGFYPGLRYREHPTRKHGALPDRYYVLTYKVKGKTVSEACGWASDNWTPTKCSRLLEQLKANAKLGQGPQTMKEMRQNGELERARQAKEAARKERENVTLAEYWPEYLSAAKTRKKATSWEKEVSHFTHHLNPNLGQVPLRKIGLEQWDFLVRTLTDAGLTPRTRQYVCLTLRQVLNHAFQRRIIPEAPPSGKVIGATVKPDSNRRTRVLTPEELQNVMAHLEVNDLHGHRITLFAALTGCRASEAFSLKWGGVDLAGQAVTFRDTKNGTARTVPISPLLVDMLKEIGPGAFDEEVFTMRNGKPYKEAPSSFRTAVKVLGLNDGRDKRDRVSFHSLRHTAATRLAGAQVPLRDLMDIGGWKTAAMALRYQHSADDTKRRALNSLESALQDQGAKVLPFPKSKAEGE